MAKASANLSHFCCCDSLIQKYKIGAADVVLTQFYQHQSMYLWFFGYINVVLLSYADAYECFVVEFATLTQLLATFNTLNTKMHEFEGRN